MHMPDHEGVVETHRPCNKGSTGAPPINQQFGLFNALVGIAVLVGVLGIINTLGMSALERTRDRRATYPWRLGLARTAHDARREPAHLRRRCACRRGRRPGIAIIWVLSLRQTTFSAMRFSLPIGAHIGMLVLGIIIGVFASVFTAGWTRWRHCAMSSLPLGAHTVLRT